jgi:hypothetical protein
MRCLLAFIFLISTIVLISGCAAQKTAWDHYDDCAAQTSTFQAMADCGKRARLAACQSSFSGCSDIGNSIVQYADALSQSVANREMTEAEAKRKFIEFKTTQAQAARQQRIQAAAAGPVICTPVGNSTICN